MNSQKHPSNRVLAKNGDPVSSAAPTGATRRLRGFTLVELLVVIAIIALLVSLVTPSASDAMRRARGVVCLSNMRQTGFVIQMAMNDDRGRLINYRLASSGTSWHGGWAAWPRPLIEKGYMELKPFFYICPSSWNPDTPQSTGAASERWFTYGYKINRFQRFRGDHNWVQEVIDGRRHAFTQRLDIAMPSAYFLLIDSKKSGPPENHPAGGRPWAVHGENVNVLFGDGAARPTPLSTFQADFQANTQFVFDRFETF